MSKTKKKIKGNRLDTLKNNVRSTAFSLTISVNRSLISKRRV